MQRIRRFPLMLRLRFVTAAQRLSSGGQRVVRHERDSEALAVGEDLNVASVEDVVPVFDGCDWRHCQCPAEII